MSAIEDALRRMVDLRNAPFCEHDEYRERQGEINALLCRKCDASVAIHASIPWPEGLHLPQWAVPA